MAELTIHQRAFDLAFKQRMKLLKTLMEQAFVNEKKIHITYRIDLTDIAIWAAFKADHLMSLHDEMLAGSLDTDYKEAQKYFGKLDEEIEQKTESFLKIFEAGRTAYLKERRKHILVGAGFLIALGVSLILNYYV